MLGGLCCLSFDAQGPGPGKKPAPRAHRGGRRAQGDESESWRAREGEPCGWLHFAGAGMATSPKAAGRCYGRAAGVALRSRFMAALFFVGVLCWAFVAVHLHRKAQDMASVALSLGPHGDPAAGPPLLGWSSGGAAPVSNHGQGRLLHRDAQRTHQPSGPAKAFFALVPRPFHLRALRLEADGVYQNGSSLTLWIGADVGLDGDGRLKAATHQYEQALGARAQTLRSTRWDLPLGAVAVVIKNDTGTAFRVCTSLVRYNGTLFTGPKARNIADELRSEWHVAILWQGRLAVCGGVAGVFRFAATLRQMLDLGPSGAARRSPDEGGVWRLFQDLPSFGLEDWPKFAWRGLHLDCVRHFMPVDFIKRYLQAMAYYKANTFHWHLTDDQAWRLEIPRRPKLVRSNPWSPEFYSTEDVREIVKFAANLFIEVVPTIETPGHSLAALAAYPELACQGKHFEVPKTRVGTYTDIMCVGKKELEDFARDVFTEVAQLFPGQYIHVGGDEVVTVTWENSQHVRAFAGMAGLGNLGPDIMEAWYCFLTNLLKEHGRRIMMWDDHFALRDFAVTRRCPGAEESWVVQAWKYDFPIGGEDHERVLPSFGFRTVASPMKTAYLDYPVASIDYNRTLQWQVGNGHNVLGGCATMWSEDSEPKDIGGKVFPRFLGIIERLWGGAAAMRRQHVPGFLGPLGSVMVEPDDRPRKLDVASHAASQRHCEDDGPLRKFGFKCGKFQLSAKGRSLTWEGAKVTTTMDSYAVGFSPEKAVDGDEDSYFWAVAPKANDQIEVSWLQTPARLGRWFRRIVASTGAADRPGDRLDNGELWAAQWLSRGNGTGPYNLEWVQLATFNEGSASAEGPSLAKGPVAVVRVVCTVAQTKWMALREITAEEGTAQPHPTVSDLPDIAKVGNALQRLL